MIPRPAKILHLALALALALAADLVRGLSGAEAAAAMVSQRTGTYFDPHVAEAYLDLAGGTTCINAEFEDQGSTWDGNQPSGRSPGERVREGRGREGRRARGAEGAREERARGAEGARGRGREGERVRGAEGAREERARGGEDARGRGREGERAGEVAGPQHA